MLDVLLISKQLNSHELRSTVTLVVFFVVLFKQISARCEVTDVSTNYIATGISVLVNKLGNKVIGVITEQSLAKNGYLEIARPRDTRDIARNSIGR